MIGLVMFRGEWKNMLRLKSQQMRLNHVGLVCFTKEYINIKEFWAVAKVLEALPAEIRHCRLHVQVDNQAVLHTWMGTDGRARGMYPVAKKIFHLTQEKNLHLTMSFVASANNPADEFSRNLSASDSMLSPKC